MANEFRTALILNSLSKKAKQIRVEAQANGVMLLETAYSKHAIELAAQALESGVDLLVAAGGDGTVNELSQAIGRRLDEGASLPYFGIVPAGSANDFVRNFKRLPDLAEMISNARNGKFRRTDIGRLHTEERTSYFMNICDYGIGAEVVSRMTQQRFKNLSSDLSYLDAVTGAFIHAQKHHMHMKIDGQHWEGNCLAVVVANGRAFGSGLVISPYASVSSGYLNIVIIGEVSLMDYARNIPRVKSGKVIHHPGVHYFKCRELEVLNTVLPKLEADGELIFGDVRKIDVLAGQIRMAM
jgi:diacylglycerol kinase (ATP)